MFTVFARSTQASRNPSADYYKTQPFYAPGVEDIELGQEMQSYEIEDRDDGDRCTCSAMHTLGFLTARSTSHTASGKILHILSRV